MRRTSVSDRCAAASAALRQAPWRLNGAVAGVSGLGVEVAGLSFHTSIGDRLRLCTDNGTELDAEIVGFRNNLAQAMTLGPVEGLGPGSLAFAPAGPRETMSRSASLAPSRAWLGRVLDPLGQPLDGKPPPSPGKQRFRVRASPPQAVERARLGPRLDYGVKALNCFAPSRAGQRLGLFAGSGIGKSTLLGMLTRGASCDVAVVALVGERGREVREFIEDELGPEGMARAVVVVATSDAPPLLRREAAHAAMTIAEYFRDEGQSVLLLMDSVTRFCLALREIGLSVGEPPATRGYPPSVFAELPRLLERAGPGRDGAGAGFITALFTVLVEGDDHNEPIADAVRGILDGHIILDRRIAEAGRYPAIDVLRSLSRAAAGCNQPEQEELAMRARRILSIYAEMADMVRLGAYRAGSDAAIDEAVAIAPRIEAMLQQAREERVDAEASFAALAQALHGEGK